VIMGKEDYERIIGKLRERAEKAEDELAEERKYNGTKEDIRTLTELLEHRNVERDRLLAIMETIVNNHDCDPRAEAREALEEKNNG